MEKSSGLAIASMVLGIVSVCLSPIFLINVIAFCAGLLAVVFGIIVLFKEGTNGQAITGVVTGVAGFAFSVIIMVFIIIVVASFPNGRVNEYSYNAWEKVRPTHGAVYKATSENRS